MLATFTRRRFLAVATTGAPLARVTDTSTPTATGAALHPQSAAELGASVTPSAYQYYYGDLRRYGATVAGNITTALSSACAQAQRSGGAPVYIPSALGTSCSVTAGVTISSPITIYGDGPAVSVINTASDLTIFTLTATGGPGCVFRDFQLAGQGNRQAVITGYISGTTLSISSVGSGTVAVGQTIRGYAGGVTTFNSALTAGSGSSWTLNHTQSVYSPGSPGTFYLGPANPAILCISSPYNVFERITVNGFGFGIELATGGNASYLNSLVNCSITSNAMANIYAESQSHQLSLFGTTFGGGHVGWGIYLTDSSGLSIHGGDCEGTAVCGIEVDNVASTGNGAHFLSGIDFEGNRDGAGNIRIGSTSVVNGLHITGCTFSEGGTGDNYAINPQSLTGGLVSGCNFATGYGTAPVNTSASGLAGLVCLGNRGYPDIVFKTAEVQSQITIGYAASMTPNAALGNQFIVTANDSSNFTINAPSNSTTGQRINLRIRNTSGGPLGTISWSAIFKMVAFTAPSNGHSADTDFIYNGTHWVQVVVQSTAVPN
jgi:hypothetical protein